MPPPTQEQAERKALANEIAAQSDADLLLYNGSIERNFDRGVIRRCAGRRRRQNVILILVTEGGDPDAAYRIARCLQNHYKKFICFVSGFCKSAGTIIVLGANELIFSDHGEIGPIDVQMSKKDELWEFESGLTLTSAMVALQEKAFSAFGDFFTQTKARSGGTITLKTATDIAAKLTSGLFAPIYQQIDPIHVGEAARATAVATQYGKRLEAISDNLKDDALERLVSGYPSHGFVVDGKEALELFNRIRKPTDREEKLAELLGWRSRVPFGLNPTNPLIEFVSDELEEVTNDKESDKDATVEGGAGPIAAAVSAAARGPVPEDGKSRSG